MARPLRPVRWALAWLVADVAIVLLVGTRLGWRWVVLAFIVGAVLGMLLIRTASASAVRAMARGDVRSSTVTRAAWRFVAGMAIAIPGFISDCLGIALLIPAVQRRLGQRLLASPWMRPWVAMRFPTATFAQGDVIVGEVLESDPLDDTAERGRADGGRADGQSRAPNARGTVIAGEILDRQDPGTVR